MDRKTADLGSFIASCHSTQYQRFSIVDRVFDQGITHLRPQLENNRTNRILLYPGSFNPPHRGHDALLCRAFACSQDINVIAAIVLLLDDNDVEAKCRCLGDKVVFTKEERVRLWRGYVPHDWRWVYDRSEKDWHSFRRRLTDVITRDGFDLKFVVLAGPDYIKRDSTPPWNAWGCEEIIVSNAGRAADFITPRHALEQLTDCGPWQSVIWDDEEVLHHTKRSAAFLGGGMSLLAPAFLREILDREPNYFEHLIDDIRSEHENEIKAVRVCARKGATKETIRFISSKDQVDDISSTHIRQIIEAGTPETLRERLESFALNPDILVNIIQTRGRHRLSHPGICSSTEF